MNGWQDVDAMWEADTAALWERLNEPDPAEGYLKSAAVSMGQAIDLIDKAEDQLAEAISELSYADLEDKVSSMLDTLMDLKIDIRILKEKYERGDRG